MSSSKLSVRELLVMLVAGLYVMTSIVGLKAVPFGPFVIASGVLLIAAVKPILDVINEVYGAQATRATVVNMSIVRAVVFAALYGISLLPAVKEPPGFSDLLVGSVWLFLAGVLAELVASLAFDVPIFTWLKEHTRSPFLLRQYMSNASLVVQTAVFATIYTLVVPGIPWGRFFIGQTVALVIVSSILAPVAALVVRRIKA